MKYESDTYESDILEMLHENASTEFRLGLISEAEMREFDKLCLTKKALKKKVAQGDNAHETVNIEHADLITA
jgi:DNA-binding transcriptional regulator YiaG